MNTLLPASARWGVFKLLVWFCYLPSRVSSVSVAEPAVLLRREASSEKAPVQLPTEIAGQQVNAHDRFERRDEAAWTETVTWLRAHGAAVNEDLVGRSFVGSDGVPTRGVFFKAGQVKQGEVLLRVPKRLWLHLDSFPRIRTAVGNIKHLFERSDDFDEFLLSINVALETVKGATSFFYPYLKGLPDIEEYRAYLPMFASEEILSTYGELPIVNVLRQQQEVHNLHKHAFEVWQQLPHHPIEVDALSWQDVELALIRVRTRSHSVIDEAGKTAYALVPACDWMNTAEANAINTFWDHPRHDELALVAARDISAGRELRAPYCLKCHNAHLLSVWGIYVNGNPYSLGGPKDVDCDKGAGYRRSDKSMRTLKQTTEEILDLSQTEHDLSFENQAAPKAPRCRQPNGETLTERWLETQGPIRCSLARLAWEHCANSWEKSPMSGKETAAVKLPKGISTAKAEVEDANDMAETGQKPRVEDVVVATKQMPATSEQKPVRARMPAGLADALAAAAAGRP